MLHQKIFKPAEHFQKNRKNTKLTYKNWAIAAQRNNSKIGVLFQKSQSMDRTMWADRGDSGQ